jgi:hypothetical protein
VVSVALSGCSSSGFDVSGAWFSKPLDVFGRNYGYTYSELQGQKTQRPVGPNDLVDQNGACAQRPAPAPAQAAANPGAPGSPEAAPALDGGVAIGMSECDVVSIAGRPGAVQLGSNPNGARTAQLTYNGGPHPGIYHFENGRLMEMDSVATPSPPPRVAVRKGAKPHKPPKADDQS